MKSTLILLALGLSGSIAVAQTPIKPRADGVLELSAAAAAIHGQTARLMNDVGSIGYWSDPAITFRGRSRLRPRAILLSS